MTEVEAAIGIIKRLEKIASNDMMIRGHYIETYIHEESRVAPYRPDLHDAPCGGYRACMVGSFFLASGLSISDVRIYVSLRDEIADRIPGMKTAREALNSASREHPAYPYSKLLEDMDLESNAFDSMEELFENSDVEDEDLGPLVHEICEKALEKLNTT